MSGGDDDDNDGDDDDDDRIIILFIQFSFMYSSNFYTSSIDYLSICDNSYS